jgi:hypothetical protein
MGTAPQGSGQTDDPPGLLKPSHYEFIITLSADQRYRLFSPIKAIVLRVLASAQAAGSARKMRDLLIVAGRSWEHLKGGAVTLAATIPRYAVTIRNLNALLHPRSVALIAAFTKTGSLRATVLENVLRGGCKGPIYPVNPH